MIEPAAERLLEKVDNQYSLVVLAARRARQIVDYYTKLGAGLEEKPLPPLLDDRARDEAARRSPSARSKRTRSATSGPPEVEESVK